MERNSPQNMEEALKKQQQQHDQALGEATKLFQEAWKMQHEIPVLDNYDLNSLDDMSKELLMKQNQMLRDMADEKFKNATELLNKEMEKGLKEIYIEREGTSGREKLERAGIAASLAGKFKEIAKDIHDSVKETFQHWREAVSLSGQKLENVKENAYAYRQAVTDIHKVRSAVKAADKIFSMDTRLAEAQKQAVLEKMRQNEQAVAQYNQRAEGLYDKAMRQNERAYGLELAKAGVQGVLKNLLGKKENIIPPKDDYLVPREPFASKIKDAQQVAIEFTKENLAYSHQLKVIERQQIEQSIEHGIIERPEGMSKENFDKATEKVREAMCFHVAMNPEKAQRYEEFAVEKVMDGDSVSYKYDTDQLRQIKLGYEAGLDAEKYANPELSASKMAVIRTMEEHGIDFSVSIEQAVAMSYADLKEAAYESVEEQLNRENFDYDISEGMVDTHALQDACYESVQYTNGEHEEDWEIETAEAFREGVREAAELAEGEQNMDAETGLEEEIDADLEEPDFEADPELGREDEGMDI